MLNQVEGSANGPLAASGVEAEWPHHRWVRVDSKSQAPYKFHPCFNPCVPNEWPYDLDALRGTEDWNDVISWFLSRHSAIAAEDLAYFAEELVRCAKGRPISVKVANDPELARLSLWFTMWGFPDSVCGMESQEIRSMDRIWFSVPALRRLTGDIGVDVGHGSFEDCHPSTKR
jgi:hypothetical protein